MRTRVPGVSDDLLGDRVVGARRVTEAQVVRLDLEEVQRPRSEEDPLARVLLGRRGELSLRELEDRLAGVVQTEHALDLREDTLAFVGHHYVGIQRVLLHADVHVGRARMVDRVVDHLGRRVMPDVADVLRKTSDDGRDQLAPDQILLQAFAGVGLFCLGQRPEPVDASARRTLSLDGALPCHRLEITVRHLARQAEFASQARSDTVTTA